MAGTLAARGRAGAAFPLEIRGRRTITISRLEHVRTFLWPRCKPLIDVIFEAIEVIAKLAGPFHQIAVRLESQGADFKICQLSFTLDGVGVKITYINFHSNATLMPSQGLLRSFQQLYFPDTLEEGRKNAC